MVFTTEEFLKVAIESWSEKDLKPRPPNSIDTLNIYIYIYAYCKHKYIYKTISLSLSLSIYIYIYIQQGYYLNFLDIYKLFTVKQPLLCYILLSSIVV